MSDSWMKMSAGDLGRRIGAGEINPVDLTQAYLDAIVSHPMGPRIYARTTADRALSEARAAAKRARAGARFGPLDGVPISWKDLFDTAGTATEAGSALLAGRMPTKDARVLANATGAGLVCLGKTHMSELAFSGLGYNPVTATPPCVNDLDAVSGGSSSGAAASVAFDLAACAIGSDTGGSVRIPAAWNDLVGLKTSAGRVSLQGVVQLCEKFDTVGPLCRTVEDAALMLAALEGGKAADLRGASLQGMRLAVLTTVAQDDLRAGPAQGFEAATQRLSSAGAQIVDIAIPEVDAAMALSGVLFATEAYATWREVIEAAPEKMYSEILARFRSGNLVPAVDYIAGWQKLAHLRAAYLQKTAGFDAVLVPTSPILPPNLDRLATDNDYYVAENLLALRNTRIGNLLGLSAVSLPTGVASAGLTLMAPPMGEERLLRLAKAAEAALA